MNVTENRRGITKVKKKTASPIFWKQRHWFFTPLKHPEAHSAASCRGTLTLPLAWVSMDTPPSSQPLLKIGPLASFHQCNDLHWNGLETNQAWTSLPSPSPTSRGSKSLWSWSVDYSLIKRDHLRTSSWKLIPTLLPPKLTSRKKWKSTHRYRQDWLRDGQVKFPPSILVD